MEVGFFSISPNEWRLVGTTYTNFTDPVVFLSLPNLAGETSHEGKSMSLRVRNTKLTYVNRNTKYFEFEARSYDVNDSTCTRVNEFYTPADVTIPNSFIGWLAVERGMFNVSHKAFIINTDVINRTNVNDSTDPRNRFKSFSQNGACNFGQNCRMDSSDNLLTIAQLQTTRYERFLLLRGVGTGRRFVVYVLTPHDSLEAANFYIPSPGEAYAWMLFEEGLEVTCVEDLVIETYRYDVTATKISVTYANTFLIPPALFGMVFSLHGRDSVGLRGFNVGVNGADFITQEDKCTDAETEHTSSEDAGVLVIGRTAVSGTTVCGAVFNVPTLLPTPFPTIEVTNDTCCVEITLYDTFGDGWGDNVALKVSGENFGEEFIYYDCPNNTEFPIVLCFPPTEKIHYDIVTFDPPAKETWEMYWVLRTLGQNGNFLFEPDFYLGDYDTNMTVTCGDVEVTNPVDYVNETCSRCKHPPKKAPPKGKSSSSSRSTRSSSEDVDSNSTVAYSSSNETESLDITSNRTEAASVSKSKPKPAWPFPFSLYDVDGDGWFNASEAWVPVPQHHCDESVSYSDTRRLIDVLTSPEYIISTIDRIHDLRRGTMCGDLFQEECEERLPDGKYIFRVTGALSNDEANNASQWRFCGRSGYSSEELEFKLVKGKCKPGLKISARELCCGETTSDALYYGSLVLSNVGGNELTEFDTDVLEILIAEAFSVSHAYLHGSVSLTSWELSGSALTVQFRLDLDPTFLDIAFNHYTVLENLAADLLSGAQPFFSGGSFLSSLQTSLQDLPLGENDVLAGTGSGTLLSLEYAGSMKMTGGDHAVDLLQAQPEMFMSVKTTQSVNTLQSFNSNIIVVVLSVVGTLVAMTAYKKLIVGGNVSEMVDKSVDQALLSGSSTQAEGQVLSPDLIPELAPNFN